ncbi:hypothetical protein [Reyranella sp. CPCC 100927]|uniref:hypothetical protein n=1 Tax=Reyranella sp. CPCC 100927 TaxID=2599616 RepID=UPI0011B51B9B|nr:hypothetical protein [Reyranella sp. CPCC 100927]TWT08658.1 hypothetical protein FQU96_21795 [Reyranella sp. CPCC 100927]
MAAALAELLALAGPVATPRALGLLELEADRQFHHIAAGDRHRLVDAALEEGASAARTIRRTFGLACPDDIAGRLGIEVKTIHGEGGFGTVAVFADHVLRPASVRLYAPALAALDACLDVYPDRDGLGATGTRPVFLAHELFHHLEGLRPAHALAARHRVALFAIGPLTLTAGLSSLAEIAAGAFAQQLLGLRYHPKLLDVMALFGHDVTAAQRLVERLCAARPTGP